MPRLLPMLLWKMTWSGSWKPSLLLQKNSEADKLSNKIVAMKPENYQTQLEQKIQKILVFASNKKRLRQHMGYVIWNHPTSYIWNHPAAASGARSQFALFLKS